jgi:ABC-type cobalamin/Fe3+-siderophores transport system ATPase subunit
MTSCFQVDDIVGGVREGVLLLAQHARHPRVLHLDEPA